MAKITVAQLPAKLYELLAPLTPEERNRVVQATLILFGEEAPVSLMSDTNGAGTRGKKQFAMNDASKYFDLKIPKNKGETLAVAARFRELILKETTHTKADLKSVIASARRNFDDNNFARDINNAKRQAGFFNLGTGRDASKLSYYGQQFVDALPNREVASKLKRPKVGGGHKKIVKKKTAK